MIEKKQQHKNGTNSLNNHVTTPFRCGFRKVNDIMFYDTCGMWRNT